MMERQENIIIIKTEKFADRIINMCKFLSKTQSGGKVMLNQIYRSGTSIGANTAESQYAQSRADFLSKLTIALKEANETRFWLGRLYAGGMISEEQYESMVSDNEEIIKLLTSITGTVKRSQ